MNPQDTFRLRFSSPTAKPNSIPLSALIDLLKALNSAVHHVSRGERRKNDNDPPVTFGLVGVHDTGSTAYAIAPTIDDPGLTVLSGVESVLQHRWIDPDAKKISDAFREVVDKIGSPLELYPPGSEQHSVEIVPGEIAQSVTISGVTTLYGKLVRIGGVEPKAVVRTGQGTVSIILTEEFARRLSPHLYEQVGLTGKATWNADTLELLRFAPSDISAYHPTSIVKSFEELASVSGPDAWTGKNRLIGANGLDLEDGESEW